MITPRFWVLKPFFSFEEEDHDDYNCDHNSPKYKVSIAVFQEWNIVEIHPIYTDDKGKRDKNS